MGKTKRNLKILTGVLSALLVFSVAGNLYYWDKNRDLSDEKSRIEQQANALMSGQSRDITQLNRQVELAQREKQSLTGKVKELNSLLSQANTDIWELRTRKADKASNLAFIRSRTQAIESQASQLAADKEQLIEENKHLAQELSGLSDSLQALVDNSLTADGFRMVALKRNNKETAKAKKVHVLNISFTVPAAIDISSRQEVFLSLTDAEGNALDAPVRTITLANNTEIPVHAERSVKFTGDRQAVTFTIRRTGNIEPGIYRASVYTKDNYLGSVETQFRDSFWFF